MNILSAIWRKFAYLPVVVLLLLSPSLALAEDKVPAFNNIAGDQEFLQGWNVTRNSGISDPVYANGGEEVGVIAYYHNTVEGSVARNTRLKITLPAGKAKEHVIKGQLSADNAQTVTGTIINNTELGRPDFTIYSSGETEVEFIPGSVRWYPDRAPTVGDGATLPGNQDPNTLITTGINIGDIEGCFRFSGSVYFKVKLIGAPAGQAILGITKDVRKAHTEDAFIDQVTVNPGMLVEFRITVRNIDGAVSARELRVQDLLPAGFTYVGPTNLRLSDGTISTLPEGLVSSGGLLVVPELKGTESLQITFIASTDQTKKDGDCLTNEASASSPTAKEPVKDTAGVCFVVPPTPTPTPTATPTPIPNPTPTPVPPTPTPTPVPKQGLPKTGPEMSILFSAGLTGIGAVSVRRAYFKKKLKKSWRNIEIV